MELLSAIALVLLTMVGYSSGITLAGRGQQVMPSIWDLLLLLLVWIGAFQLRAQLDSRLLSLLVGLLLGIVVGWLFTLLRLAFAKETPIIPESELPEHARETTATQSLSLPRKLWQRWNIFAARMGAVQGRMLMGYFYFIIVTPFGAGFRLLSDPLHKKRPFSETGWLEKEQIAPTVEAAQEQG